MKVIKAVTGLEENLSEMSATCACNQLLEERSSRFEKDELSTAIKVHKCTQSAPVEAHQTSELFASNMEKQ